MGVVGILQTIFVPALISLALYLLLSLVIVPFARSHRHRYDQYLPLDALSTRTMSLRQRIADSLTTLVLPSTWGFPARGAADSWPSRARRGSLSDSDDDSDEDDGIFDPEDGEHLVGVAMDARRREALESRRSDVSNGECRLSRDLEEGFRDDSSDEEAAVVDDRSRRR
ncbi:MAG: Processing alpha glucosidase I [Watsoniomyces obsoletus]|nr:MAG: Processing alpha glucosidase I [Watsoniomyces obsoletus]